MDKKFYGLVLPKQLKSIQPKSRSIFDSSDEDEEASTSKKSLPSKLLLKNKSLQDKLMQDDPTIYEYDSVYDSMKQKQVQKEISAKKEGPRYINSLLKAAEKRKKEQERRQERKIQIEREKEGNEFKDKEAFVTSAYKKKMLEMQEEEEREKFQDQVDEMMDVTKQKDLSGFYRHYLNQTVGEEAVPEFGDRESEIKKLTSRIKTESVEDIVKENSSVVVEQKKPGDNQTPVNLDADSYSSSEEQSSDTDEFKSSQADEKSKSQYSYSSDRKKKLPDLEGDNMQMSPKKHLKSDEGAKSLYSNNSSDSEESSDTENKLKSQKHKTVITKSTSAKAHKCVDNSSDKDNKKVDQQSIHSSTKKWNKKRSHSSDSSTSAQSDKIKRVNEHSSDKRLSVMSDESNDHASMGSGQKRSNTDNGNNAASESAPKTKPKCDISVKFIKRTVGDVFDHAQSRYFARMAAKKSNRNI